MNINQVREQLHRLIDEIDDLYVLNGLYRSLLAEKRSLDVFKEKEAGKGKRRKV